MNSKLPAINGKTYVSGVEVPNIVGGFGEDKKSMLAKNIAAIHGKNTFKVNELVNKNKSRFKEGIDIIDLKHPQYEKIVILLMDNNFISKMEISKAENLFSFSERGYAKLLKIFEDDLAWEKYDEIIDGYFRKYDERIVSEKIKELEIKQARVETARKNASIREAKLMMEFTKTYKDKLSPESITAMLNAATTVLTGRPLLPPPVIEKTYTAEELGKELGVTNNMIGRVANKHGLKTDEYGINIIGKSKYSDKQVTQFIYNETGRLAVIEAFTLEAQAK